MHVPQPLPDELAAGYLGRLFLVNGLKVSAETKRSFSSAGNVTSESSSETPWTSRAAALVGQSAETFRFQHTLLPFYAGIQVGEARDWLDPIQRATDFHVGAHRSNPHGNYLCRSCAVEDQSFWGVSYWRRSHQLPGTLLCAKHEEDLWVAVAGDAKYKLPHVALDQANPSQADVLQQAQSSPVIRRYTDICAALLERRTTFTTHQMVECLQQRANQVLIRPRGRSAGQHFSELVLSMIDGPWQREFFPELSSKTRGAYVALLDRTITCRDVAQRSAAYALAMAVLFDSADTALSALSSGASLPNAATGARGANAPEPGITTLDCALKEFAKGRSITDICSGNDVCRAELESALRRVLQHSLRATPGREPSPLLKPSNLHSAGVDAGRH